MCTYMIIMSAMYVCVCIRMYTYASVQHSYESVCIHMPPLRIYPQYSAHISPYKTITQINTYRQKTQFD